MKSTCNISLARKELQYDIVYSYKLFLLPHQFFIQLGFDNSEAKHQDTTTSRQYYMVTFFSDNLKNNLGNFSIDICHFLQPN